VRCRACGSASSLVVPPSNNRVPFLDTLRGFAALWVVLFHCAEGHHVPTLMAALPGWLDEAVFSAGHLGVPVFFVLSGFVVARISAGTIDCPRAAGRFLLQRLVRLSPPYYVAVALGAMLLLVKSHSDGAARPRGVQVLAHLVYGQTILGVAPLNAVFWTLAIEVQFYIAFALLLWLAHAAARRLRRADVATGLLGVAAAVALLWPARLVETLLWRGGFIALWYSFLCGSLVAMSGEQRGWRQGVAPACIAAVAAVGAWRQDTFALTAAGTALFIFVAERKPAVAHAFDLTPLTALGLVSYSLYLFHNPVTGIVGRLVRRCMPGGLLSDVVLFACVVGCSVGVAALMYFAIEKPAVRWSHRVLGRRVAPR